MTCICERLVRQTGDDLVNKRVIAGSFEAGGRRTAWNPWHRMIRRMIGSEIDPLRGMPETELTINAILKESHEKSRSFQRAI
ncbi:MAG: hypothetical protein ACOYEP_10345 [Limnochordia bacterium]|jgi:hypothetical protein